MKKTTFRRVRKQLMRSFRGIITRMSFPVVSKKRFFELWDRTKKRSNGGYKRTIGYIQRYPLRSFYIILGVFILLIVLGNVLQKPPVASVSNRTQPKPVTVYHIGSAPKLTLQAQIEKTGVVKVVAMTSGIVEKVYHREGEEVRKGESVVGLSSNYQGGNTFSLQRQIAQAQYNTTAQTYDSQKEIIQKQREVAEKTKSNADALRDITNQSIDDTRSLLSLNEDILESLNGNLDSLEENNADDTLVLPVKQQIAQLESAIGQIRSSLRNAEYQSSGDKPPAQLAELQKDLAIKQLDVQQKTLKMNKQMSSLQLQIAQVNEGLMFPSAPFNASVQRVLIKEGELVTPGTPLMILSQTDIDPVNAIVYVSSDMANKVSRVEESTLYIGTTQYRMAPTFITTDAVSGTSYAVYYSLPDSFAGALTDKDFITIDMPIGYADTTTSILFIPIDAVYQTAGEAYVFVVKNGKAESKKVTLGDVYGSFVQISSGLTNGDQVILTRNVIADDPVLITRQ